MEDVEEEPVLDIDACDRKDTLAVVEYIDDIYSFYKDIEVTIQFLVRRCIRCHPIFKISACCVMNNHSLKLQIN